MLPQVADTEMMAACHPNSPKFSMSSLLEPMFSPMMKSMVKIVRDMVLPVCWVNFLSFKKYPKRMPVSMVAIIEIIIFLCEEVNNALFPEKGTLQ